jgi:serine/threonine-protein kinase
VIGRVIDKYKILEEVGQGGMSVVYKGMDTSLNREVAVKVLHRHLASQEEARQRFQREAHAVAKLRHPNILEIFDYSGRESAESYIVTEFIKGRTLRGFIAEHQLGFPEIAAMVVVEVCRALAHAHQGGVLHRDVKPENIMIRDDGMLKLMDFGIAQIVDSQRMTVTGQLLGSPAYMSPEHIEGRPLDFRTDVFSAGILLYQLATGELPFKGKNPHEILKRIAECRYLDARVVNPLVSDRLNRVIQRALARDPDDRYADVSLMLDDLTRFLAEVELGEPRTEIAAYFAEPVPYEHALRQRLIAVLAKRGREELAEKRTTQALELWNRVLTIDPSNEEILGLIDRLSRRRKLGVGLGLGLVLLAASGIVALINLLVVHSEAVAKPEAPPAAAPPPANEAPSAPAAVAPPPASEPSAAPPPAEAKPEPAPPPAPAPENILEIAPPPAPGHTTRHGREVPRPQTPAPNPPPAAPPPVLPPASAPRVFHLVPTPQNVTYSLDSGPFVQIEGGSVDVEVGPGLHKLVLRSPLCCEDVIRTIEPADSGRALLVRLPFKPTKLRPVCPQAKVITVKASSTGQASVVDSGVPIDIRDFSDGSKERVDVDFYVEDHHDHQTVVVQAGAATTEVVCH